MIDHAPYRDGKVHVMAEKCNTCVFHPGNRMHLEAGRLGNLVTENIEAESALQCHKTLPYSPEQIAGAVCRGFYDSYKFATLPLRLAIAMDLVEFDAHPA